jgi:hypothetical protein
VPSLLPESITTTGVRRGTLPQQAVEAPREPRPAVAGRHHHADHSGLRSFRTSRRSAM